MPAVIRQRVVDLALATPERTPRELAWQFTDRHGHFLSESSVYRILKTYDLITSPAFVVMSAGMKIAEDPEGLFHVGWMLSDLGEREQAVGFLRQAVDRGYYAAPTLAASTAFDGLRSDPAFLAVLADAEAGRGKALAAYREAGGEELLGMWAAAFGRLDALLKRQSESDAS